MKHFAIVLGFVSVWGIAGDCLAQVRGKSIHVGSSRIGAARPYGTVGTTRVRPLPSSLYHSPRPHGFTFAGSLPNGFSHALSRAGYTRSGYYAGSHSQHHHGHSHGLYRSGLYGGSLYRDHLYGHRHSHHYHVHRPSVSLYYGWRPLIGNYYSPMWCYPGGYTYSTFYARPYTSVFLGGYGSFTYSTRSTAPIALTAPPRITHSERTPSTSAMDALLATMATPPTERIDMLRGAGDSYFSAGRYMEAVSRYTSAVEREPTDSESLFRLGHALTAIGQYDTATRAFKAAVSLGGDLRRGRFSLDSLYGGAAGDKAFHMERLARHALENPSDADAFFLVGMFLKYDGQDERAQRFFQKSLELNERLEASRRMLTPAEVASAIDV